MPTQEAEGIVLRRYSLSDSDRIVVFVTREFGKVRAVARGAKRPQSPMGGALEPLSHVKLEYSAREGRDLQQLRRAELIHAYLGKNLSLESVYLFSYFAEIANEMVQDNQPNQPMFRLLLASLEAGEGNGDAHALARYYEIWSLRLSGLLPDYDYCSNCGKCVKDDGFFAWLESGQVRCGNCAEGRGLRIGAAAASALDAMTRLGPGQFAERILPREAAVEIERLAQRLLGLHLERELKSYRILRGVLQR